MIIRNVLIDEQWKRIEPLLSGKPSDWALSDIEVAPMVLLPF